MNRPPYEPALVGVVHGQAEAEMLRGLLEAHGIEVWLSGESAGAAIGLAVGGLGRVELWVRETDLDQARQLFQQETGRSG